MSVFSVECEFAKIWTKHAPSEYFQIYVYMLYYFNENKVVPEPEEVARVLCKNGVVIENAFEFWQEVGLLAKSTRGTYCFADKKNLKNQKMLSKQMYSPLDISNAMNKNRKVCELFKTCEILLGQPLSHSYMQLIYSIYDWLGLEIEAIFVLLTYAVERGKSSARWIEKTAIDWADKEIKTQESAEHYIKNLEASTKIEKNNNHKIVSKPLSKFNNFSGKHDYDYDNIMKKAMDDVLNENR